MVSTLLPLIAIAAVFWLLIIRPTQRRNKAMDQLRRSLSVGDRVMMSSGIYGTLERVEGDRVHLRVADGVVLEVATPAIASVETQAEPPTADPVVEEQ